jgi:hypothetical protein
MAEERSEQPSVPVRPRTPRQVESFIEQRIREAVERGDFDRLESKGRPLKLDLKDAIDRDAWFVNRTMKSLGAVPAWMELGKEIDTAEERLRWMRTDFERWLAELREQLLPLSTAERSRERPGIELRFEDRFARYRKQAEELRRQIDRFNLEVPVRRLEKRGVWVAHEMRRLSGPYEAFAEELGWDSAPAESIPPPAQPVAVDMVEPPHEQRAHRLLELWRRAAGRR